LLEEAESKYRNLLSKNEGHISMIKKLESELQANNHPASPLTKAKIHKEQASLPLMD